MSDPTPKQIVDELSELYEDLLIPFMKVRRDMPFPTESERQETDAEHAWTLAVVAPTLARRLNQQLDENLIIKYAVVHDMVEAYAGDVSVRHPDYHNKAGKEHEAYLEIQKRFLASAPWIAETIRNYEDRNDAESRFVYATDKLLGALTRLADKGKTWASYYPETDGSNFHAVVERLRVKAEAYPELLPVFDALHHHLDTQWPGYLGIKPHQN